jgi:predicted transcriptional regulator
MMTVVKQKNFRKMVLAYNFIASWQLFPEKGEYQLGNRPKSGYYKIQANENSRDLNILHTWVSLENDAFNAEFSVLPDGELHSFTTDGFADQVKATLIDSANLQFVFLKDHEQVLDVLHTITPNGLLKIVQKGFTPGNNPYTNTEIYHKQMSVLPYAASVSGAVIKPTEEGMIRHKALTAMEEQTNMQMDQIRQQIELLAQQAREIVNRKELSMLIYNAKLSFSPVIGQVYYLYEKKTGEHQVSMVSPREWGNGIGPFKGFVAKVKLLADHTWVELP